MPNGQPRHSFVGPGWLQLGVGNYQFVIRTDVWVPLSPGDGWQAMTLQEAKSIARHLGLTLRKVRSGDYRVNFRDGNETTAYYTDTLEDAVNAAVEMAGKRGIGTALLRSMFDETDN
jgi:hypothetical protein